MLINIAQKQLVNVFLHYYFEKQVYTFFSKIRTKKLITVFTFILQIKNALKHHLPLTFFYFNSLFLHFLKIYKAEHFITNYFRVPYSFFPHSLKCKVEKFFLINNICVLFPPHSVFSHANSFKTIVFISKPSRRIFVSFTQLLKLSRKVGITIVLSTVEGIVTHREALGKKQGGVLLCFLK